MPFRLLVINPGSTSIKLAVFVDDKKVISGNKQHVDDAACALADSQFQLQLGLTIVREFLQENDLTITDFDAVVARGGLLRPIPSGTYLVSQNMVDELVVHKHGQHPANDGAIIAWQLTHEHNIPAYIVDPVVVDELFELARITGRPDMKKESIFHALNQKAVAKRYAKMQGKNYSEISVVVAHMGGGISVGCHHKGRVIEVNNGLDGEGPFSPNRLGTVQAREFFELVNKNKWHAENISEIFMGKSGVYAHLGTADMREVEERADNGDERARLIFAAMAYQTARYIAATAVAAKGAIEQIILTGGIAHSQQMTDKIIDYVRFIAPVTVMPGEDEMQALAEGALRVLTGEEAVLTY